MLGAQHSWLLNTMLPQVNDASENGSKVKAFYRLIELPVTLVIDPMTGAAPKSWIGAIEPQRLCAMTPALPLAL